MTDNSMQADLCAVRRSSLPPTDHIGKAQSSPPRKRHSASVNQNLPTSEVSVSVSDFWEKSMRIWGGL